MIIDGLEPSVCLVSFGSPDSSIFELVTMIVVFARNPNSSVWNTKGSTRENKDIDSRYPSN